MNLTVLHVSYKWNHICHFVTCLFHLAYCLQRFIHVVACVRISFLLHLNNTSLYSSVTEHLDCFHLLAVGDQYCYEHACTSVSLSSCFKLFRLCTRSGIDGSCCNSFFFSYHVVILCLNFEDLSFCFPQQLHHFIFLLAVHKGFSFAIPLLIFVIYCFFSPPQQPSQWVRSISPYGFGLHFPNDQ